MKKNNYDQSSTGNSVELVLFGDLDSSRMNYDDNFECLFVGRSGSVLQFTDCGMVKKMNDVSELVDWDRVSEEEAESFLRDNAVHNHFTEEELMEQREEYVSWADYAEDWVYQNYSFEDIWRGRDLPDIGPSAWDACEIRGYSQGDITCVLYKPSDWLGRSPADYFRTIIYECPVHARLRVNGEEYHLDDHMEDIYLYDKDEMEGIIDSLDISDKAKEVAKELLPNHLDYA